MPVTYALEERIVVIRAEGQYSIEELEDALLLALTDPARCDDAVLLIDVRESEALRSRPPEDIRAMGRLLSRRRARFRSCLGIVAPTDLQFGLMRIAQATLEAGGVTACVFRELAPARAWLAGEPAVREPTLV